MNDNETKKEFKCTKCGCCCKNVASYEPASFLDRGDGTCKYFNESERLCSIYEFRPDICRVDKMYKLYKDKMSWEEYLDLNYESCEYLREKEGYRKNNIESKSNEVIKSIKETPKIDINNDLSDNKIIINNNEEEDYLFDDDEDFFGGV